MRRFIRWLQKLHSVLFDWFWQRMIRVSPKKNKVVATAYAGRRYDDNPKLIVEKIHELSPETEIVWVTEDGYHYDVPDFVRTVSKDAPRKMMREIIGASVVIDNDMKFVNIEKKKNQLHINTWHGSLAIKKIGLDREKNPGKQDAKSQPGNFADVILSNSKEVTGMFRTAFAYDGPVWECGYPAEADLLCVRDEREKVRKLYGLPLDRKVIIYMPTLRRNNSWKPNLNIAGLQKAVQERFGGEWTVMVRWHPDRQKEGYDTLGAVDATGYPDVQELIKAVDAFVTDYSASIFQAAMLGKPGFLYANDYDDYSRDVGLSHQYDELPFPSAVTDSELFANIISYDADLWEARQGEYTRRVGHIVREDSCRRIAEMALDFIHTKDKTAVLKRYITK